MPRGQAVVDDEPYPQTGARLAVAEAFWLDGLQPGRGEPVVLERMQAIGYRVFTSISSLREYVDREAALDAGESRALDGSRA